MAPWPLPDDGSGQPPAHRPAPRTSRDRTLADDVVARLVGDERTRLQSIAVEVQNGVAILTGRVDTTDLMFVAGGLAWQTRGIIDVCNVLEPSDRDNDPAGT
ncbi:hypothetical protein Psuf_093530 [Phytohabitans suffuscus]|uniref:BON domain-containing protein n=2 Tax=Phytohabitans suffuscus TaxID=624315 RepID=A0A6F8Z0S9_9ACTN|nr:hypothetical protein Psuf_093530 [Phytohabitans suffuscus]